MTRSIQLTCYHGKTIPRLFRRRPMWNLEVASDTRTASPTMTTTGIGNVLLPCRFLFSVPPNQDMSSSLLLSSSSSSSPPPPSSSSPSSSPLISTIQTTHVPTTMDRILTDAVKRLLNREETQVGFMDTLDWHLAETVILQLTQPENGKRQQEILETSFELLNRLAEEAAVDKDDTDTSGIFSGKGKKRMDIYLVHAILKQWNHSFRNGLTSLRPSQVCQMVEELVEKSKHRLFEPNIATYTMILDGAAACPDPKERLEFSQDLLARLITEADENPLIRPTVVTFGTLINALAKSKAAPFAEKAEKLLRRLQQLHEAGWPDVEPNTVVYTSVIHAWANVGDAQRAEALLQEMYKDAVLDGNLQVAPTTRTFNAVLLAWSKSNDINRVDSAEFVIRKMIDLAKEGTLANVEPDLVSYNSMLSVIARGRKFMDALDKAEYWMEQLLLNRNSLQPSLITYKILFRIIAYSAVSDKAARGRFWLEKCTNAALRHDESLSQKLEEMEGSRSRID